MPQKGGWKPSLKSASAAAVDQQEETRGNSHPEIVVFTKKKWRELEDMSPTQAVKRTR